MRHTVVTLVAVCVYAVCWSLLSSVNRQHNVSTLRGRQLRHVRRRVQSTGARIRTDSFVQVRPATRLLLPTHITAFLVCSCTQQVFGVLSEFVDTWISVFCVTNRHNIVSAPIATVSVWLCSVLLGELTTLAPSSWI